MSEVNKVSIIVGESHTGKSEYLRKIAINVILAQIGCHVPA
jgi:DNA mismatch repair ATPase MutS